MLDGGGNSVEHLAFLSQIRVRCIFLQHLLVQNRTNFICGISMQNQLLRFFKIAPSKLSLIILIQKSKTPNRVILFCLYMNSIIMSSVKTRASKNWFHVRFYWFLRAQHLSVKNGGWEGVILLTVLASVVCEWVYKSTNTTCGQD